MAAIAAVPAAAVRPLLSGATWRAAVYHALAPVIGFTWFMLLAVGVPLGAGLVIVWVGVPILLALLATCRAAAAAERRLANALLDADVEAPAALRDAQGSIWQRVVGLMKAASTWRAVAWMVLRFPLAMAFGVVLIVVLSVGLTLLAAPFDGTLRHGASLAGVAGVVGGLALILLLGHLVDLGATVMRGTARALLGPSAAERRDVLARRVEEADARTALARDLHDSVGHSVTAAVVQASAARRVLDEDPAFAREALEAIEAQGRAALEELDRVLGVLRDEGRDPSTPPTLADLGPLVARTRAAGVALTVEERGDLDAVPERASREAYRVVQEGLTNAMRHAHGAPVRLAVVADGERGVAVDVESGPGASVAAAPGGGRGLAGIGERLRPLGGRTTSGPTADGGFLLHAEIPGATHA